MKNEDLDRILSADQDIVPSSGFVASVMNAVRDEAGAPPPIPFPWTRALPGLAAAGFAFAYILVKTVEFLRAGAATQVSPTAVHILDAAKMWGAGWVLLALLLTLASVALSMHLIRES
jgi:hypothetical protein